VAVHKVSKPGDGVPKDPPRVRRFPLRPCDDPSRQRVADLVRVSFLHPSAAESHLADTERDPLQTKRTT
jgi:hypothetical protein